MISKRSTSLRPSLVAIARTAALVALGAAVGWWIGNRSPAPAAPLATTVAVAPAPAAPCMSSAAPEKPHSQPTAAHANVAAAIEAYREAWERGNLLAHHADRAIGVAIDLYASKPAALLEEARQSQRLFSALLDQLRILAVFNDDQQSLVEIQALSVDGFPAADVAVWQQLLDRLKSRTKTDLKGWASDLPSPDALAYSFNPNQLPLPRPKTAPLELLRTIDERTRSIVHASCQGRF